MYSMDIIKDERRFQNIFWRRACELYISRYKLTMLKHTEMDYNNFVSNFVHYRREVKRTGIPFVFKRVGLSIYISQFGIGK